MNKIAKLLIGINRPGTGSVLYGWGYNAAYQLGIGPDQGSRTQVTLLDNTSSWTQLVTGQYFSAGIKSDGTLWTWGQGSALGDGQGILGTSTTPKRIGTSTWSSVSAGLSHVAAIRSDGRLFTWGFNFYGQLGDGTNSNKSSPVVIGTSSWTAVSAGASHTAAIRSDGTLWTWGLNDAGQLAQISSLASTSSPVQVGNTTIVGGPTSTLTPITRTLLGTASLTSSVSNAGDDNYWTLTLPWSVSFLGTSYSTLYVGTNMYITFGAGSTVYSGLSASTPALPKIALFAADRSGQRIYYGTEGVAPNRTYRIKFEGSTGTSGTLGSPTMGYEIVFYEADPTKFDIHMTHLSSTTGLLGIYTASALVQTITTSQLSLTNSVSITTGQIAGGTTPAYSWNQVSAGARHTAAIRNDGTLWSWGLNSSGQLGDSTITNKSSPVQIGTGSWTQVKASENNTYAIDTNSNLWSWGRGDLGMLGSGSGTITYRSSPVQVGSNSWTSIGGGTSHVLAVRSDGTLWGWGDGTRYQLTLTSTVYSWSQIQSGDNHTVAIRSDGTLWAWGSGILGDGTYYQKRSSPVQIGTSSWKQVSAGRDHTVAIRSDDMLFTWGDNVFGQLGDGTVTFTPAPYQLGTDSWTQVSAGRYYTMAIRSDGGLFAWGRNKYGQFGDDTTTNRSSPIQIGTSSWSQVDAGWYHTAAIKSDGTLWGWGDNFYGQVGKHDDLTPANTYTQFTSAYPGTDNGSLPVFAIKSDGTLWQWGGSSNTAANTWGTGETTTIPSRISPTQVGTKSWNQVAVQLQGPAVFGIDNTNNLYFWGSDTIGGYSYNTPTSLPRFAGSWAQITAGTNHQLGIKTDGTLWGWGDNTSGQINRDLALPNDSWVQITGSDTKYGIKANGTLWGWGYNYSGTLGDRTLESRSSPVQIGTWVSATDSWVSVATAQFSAAAIDYTNTLWTWGAQNYGKLGNGIATNIGAVTSPVAIGAGYAKVFGGDHSFHAIKTDGTLWAWGYNYTYLGGPGTYGDGTSISRSSPVQIGTDTWNLITKAPFKTYGIKSDGTLWGWGSSVARYLSPIQISSASIGFNTYNSGGGEAPLGAVIDTAGKLYTYGGGGRGALGTGNVVDSTEFVKIGDSSWSAVSCGASYIAAIKSDGTLWTWGDISSAGNGTTYRSSPIQVGTDTWSKLSTSGSSLGIKSNGTMWAWGRGLDGRLGDGSSNFGDTYTPVQVGPGLGSGSWSQISVGPNHCLAIDDNGKLFAWGSSSSGQTTLSFTHPTSWTQISSSSGHTAAIAFDGSLWTWGSNDSGQLGVGNVVSRVAWPIKVGNSSWSQVAANRDATVAIRSDGTLWYWGTLDSNSYRSSPVQIGTSTTYNKLTLCDGTIHAIRTDGTLWAMGEWSWGVYGVPGYIGGGSQMSPVQVPGTWKSVSGGTFFRVAIRSDDTLWAWGQNSYGQLGDDSSTVYRTTPVQIGTGLWTWVRAGQTHTAALRQDGVLFTWGYNASGQIGDGTNTNRSSPVQIGIANTYSDAYCGNGGTILQKGSQLWAAGSHGMSTPANSNSPVQIASSAPTQTVVKLESGNAPRDYLRQHIINSTGNLYYCGYAGYYFGAGLTIYGIAPYYPQYYLVTFDPYPTTNYPTQIGTSNWTYVATGSETSFAIRSDGKLFAWGRNTNGELGDNSTIYRSSPVQIGTSNWSSVAAGSSVVAAIDSSNTLFTWGYATTTDRYLGDFYAVASRSSPVQVGSVGEVNSVSLNRSSAYMQTVFVKSGSSLKGWGAAVPGITSNYIFGSLDGILSNYVSSSLPLRAMPGSWVSVSTSDSHAVAVSSNGSLWSWGVGQYGELGNGVASIGWSAPAQVGTSSWTVVSVTGDASYAIDANLRLFGWGRGDSYQLGQGSSNTLTNASPVLIGTSYSALQKDTGGLYLTATMSALNSNGEFAAWANNKYGQVGNSTANNRFTSPTVLVGGPLLTVTSPVQIGTANNWVQIAAGASHSLARNSSNVVYSWGDNSNSQCNQVSTVSVVGFGNSTIANVGFITATAWTSHGIPDTDAYSQPLWYTRYYWGRVPGTSSTSATITGVNDLYANGAAMQLTSLSVNYSGNGMIGIANNNTMYFGTSNLVSSVYTPLYTNTVSKAFVLGPNTFAVVDSSTNYPYVWGHNNYGRTGINRDGTTQGLDEEFAILSDAVQIGANGRVYSSPVQIGTSSWSQVTAGAWESLAINSQSLLFGWGRNRYGTIGDGTLVGKFSPVQIGTSSWTQVKAGSNHAAAIDNTGRLFAWGSNLYGQLGYGDPAVARSSPVQVGTSSWSFVTASSSTWGGESDHFTGAIRSDGVLYMWGAGDQGVIGNEAITNRSSPVQVGGALIATVYSPSQIGSSSGWLKTTTGFGLTSLATKTYQ